MLHRPCCWAAQLRQLCNRLDINMQFYWQSVTVGCSQQTATTLCNSDGTMMTIMNSDSTMYDCNTPCVLSSKTNIITKQSGHSNVAMSEAASNAKTSGKCELHQNSCIYIWYNGQHSPLPLDIVYTHKELHPFWQGAVARQTDTPWDHQSHAPHALNVA